MISTPWSDFSTYFEPLTGTFIIQRMASMAATQEKPM